MTQNQIKAFTLVELIVVITILAILGTIAFLSLQGYSANARDSVRISDMSNITKSIELMVTKTGKIPLPDNKVDITASGSVISYQGNAGENVLSIIGVNNGGIDPLDETYYTYVVNKNLNRYQILGFLEDGEELTYQLNKTYADLTSRYVIVKGDTLGVLLNKANYQPIQLSGTGVDIVQTNLEYMLFLDNFNVIEGSGSILMKSELLIKYGDKISCNDYLLSSNSLSGKDGFYYIKPSGDKYIEVYCDMTTHGGGWTKVYHSNLNAVFETDIVGKDWNFGNQTNYSLLWSYKDKKNKNGLFEYYIRDSSNIGRYNIFTQSSSYYQNPVGNNYKQLYGNFFYSSIADGSTWHGLSLGKFGTTNNMQTHCTLSTASQGSSWWYCLQDSTMGFGTGPWFTDDGYSDSGRSMWVEVYQK